MWRRSTVILIAIVSLLASGGALAQTVVSRARLGNNIEDITFISTGRLANNIAMMNGYELFVAPLNPPGSQTKLLDVRSTPIANGPRGIAYIESQQLIAFHPVDSGTLYLVNQDGVFLGTRPMVFPGAAPNYLEGMDYLPLSSPLYPDHLIVVANTFTDPDLVPRIEVARLDGTVEAEIVPQPFGPQPDGSFLFDPSYGMLGLAYKSPNRLLVTLNDGTDSIWVLDFNGNVVGSGPVYTDAGNTSFEGITRASGGSRFVVSNYFTGKLLFFDSNMNRLPAEDRTYSVGIGVSEPVGTAWNTDTNNHLVVTGAVSPIQLSAIPASLDSATTVSLEPRPGQVATRLTYLPGEHLVATYARQRLVPGGPIHTFIRFFIPATGAFDSEVDITDALTGGTASGIAFVPTMNQLAVGVTGGATPNALGILTRTGALVRTIDLSATGLSRPSAVAHFSPSPGTDRFLILGIAGSASAVVVTDFDGNVLPGGFDTRAGLNLPRPFDLSMISTGPFAGGFGVGDVDNSELVVFRLAYLAALSPAHLWIGLKNSDDQGTRFDVKTEFLKNETPVASGLQRCITGLTRNAADAKEVLVPFAFVPAVPVASGDVLALRVSTRIGTNPDDTRCTGPGGNHANAAGLRLYFDAASRQSRFDATIAPDPNRALYLRSGGVLSAIAPADGTPQSKDSGGVNFTAGNPFAAIGTWSLAPMP